MSKSDVYRLWVKLKPLEREELLKQLLQQGLIISKEMPKKGTKKIPIFYFITDKGQKWVDQYQSSYPQ